jgi:hypothetical protein
MIATVIDRHNLSDRLSPPRNPEWLQLSPIQHSHRAGHPRRREGDHRVRLKSLGGKPISGCSVVSSP